MSEKCSSNGSAGSDQLTAILNDYMGAMIDEVLKIQGDVLKFAGQYVITTSEKVTKHDTAPLEMTGHVGYLHFQKSCFKG